MAEQPEFEQDLGDVLYSSLKPYIILEQDLKFHNEELGEGFFGIVRKAEYLSKKMPVAVKFLKGRNTNFLSLIHIYQPRSEGDNVLGSVRPSVHLSVWVSVCALTAEPFDLRP